MKFTVIVAMIATLSLTANAQKSEPTVVLIPSNSNVQVQQQQPTVVEAAPVTDSKADQMRKARQNQEVQTEQKIVEKLEESRLKEEQQRAERLFGDKLDMGSGAAAAPVQQQVQPAQPVQPVQPVQQAPQVNIEKIEIVQPQAEKEEKAEVAPVAPVAPVAESKIEAEEDPTPVFNKKFYVGATLGAPSYGASNLKTNYGFGIIAGSQLAPNFALEGMFLYSNHYVDTFWEAPLFREMDQYDFQVTGKYLIMTGPLKPYVGASAAYVQRRYNDRIKNQNYYYGYNVDKSDSVDTYAVNVGLVAGVDYEFTQSFAIGAGLDYNTPVMKKNDFNAQAFGVPENTKPVEDFDYTTLKVNARLSF